MGDGCHEEGISGEAASLAGHLKLGKLIAIYDDNSISIDGPTNLSFSEDVGKRYESYGWHVQRVPDADTNVAAIDEAIARAHQTADRPSIILCKTTIGYGSKWANTGEVHGTPLKDDDLAQVKSRFGFDPKQSFFVPDEVRAYFDGVVRERRARHQEWASLFDRYASTYPSEAAEFRRLFADKQLPAGWKSVLPRFKPGDPEAATRYLLRLPPTPAPRCSCGAWRAQQALASGTQQAGRGDSRGDRRLGRPDTKHVDATGLLA